MRRREEAIPEFVLLFKGRDDIMLMTYVNGIPYQINLYDKDCVKNILAFQLIVMKEWRISIGCRGINAIENFPISIGNEITK